MKKEWTFWIGSLLLSMVCIVVNGHFFHIPDLIKLEFAASPEEMKTYIMSAGCLTNHNYYILKMNTIVDYGFLISYSFLTFFSLKLFLDVFQLPIKVWVYVLAFITGLLDAIENIFLIKTAILQQEVFSSVYFWVVRIKWAFAIVPMLLVPIVMLYGLILLLRAKQAN